MKLYQDDGYLNIKDIIDGPAVYSFVVGGRGVGKTFGSLKEIIDRGLKFIFMRRTQVQVDMIKDDNLNPFNALTAVLGDNYRFVMKKVNKNITAVYRAEFDPEKHIYIASGNILGYIMALSTVSNIRGFDASDVSILIYDEFIGEKHERPIRDEGAAFLNALETIARNRELQGRDPLKVLCLSNSNDLANPIFIQLKIVKDVENMVRKGQEYRYMPERHLAIYILQITPIGAAKAQTTLYKLAGDSEFTQMALSNDFSNEEMAEIKPQNIREYKPVVQVGEICIYRHKSKYLYYVTSFRSGSPEVYDSSAMDLKRFSRNMYHIWLAYLNRHVIFESYMDQVLLEKYFSFR